MTTDRKRFDPHAVILACSQGATGSVPGLEFPAPDWRVWALALSTGRDCATTLAGHDARRLESAVFDLIGAREPRIAHHVRSTLESIMDSKERLSLDRLRIQNDTNIGVQELVQHLTSKAVRGCTELPCGLIQADLERVFISQIDVQLWHDPILYIRV